MLDQRETKYIENHQVRDVMTGTTVAKQPVTTTIPDAPDMIVLKIRWL